MTDPLGSRFARKLAVVLGIGFALRALYVALEPAWDPTFARPILDGAYYIDSARAIAAGGGAPGAYYMPPLYPMILAMFLRVAGEHWQAIYLAQQALVVAGAGFLATVARRGAGEAAGLCAAVLALSYHPGLFFAARPLGEALALALLAGALASCGRGPSGDAGAGLLSGLAALARPNFLPVPFVWAVGEAAVGRWKSGLRIAAAAIVAIAPVAWHNHAASGHWIPISANGGVVFWLGNAPGAVGIYTPSPGFTGALSTQFAEAKAEAEARTGRTLDASEVDSFWWAQGRSARRADPLGTVALFARRAALTVDNAEHGLDYAPALDANPARWLAPLPFAALIAFAALGLTVLGGTRTGGFATWSALAVAAAAPIVFYVSSRHRLPVAFLLAIPAGAGLAACRSVRRPGPWIAAAVAGAVSLAIPSGGLKATERSAAFASLADVERRAGHLQEAESASRRATEADPSNAVAWFNRGVVASALGENAEAERSYRAALAADRTQPDAAANLAGLLVASHRAAEAAAVLEPALAVWPRHTVGWTNLVVAYAAAGETERAREAIRRAERAGVTLEPELVKTVEGNGTP